MSRDVDCYQGLVVYKDMSLPLSAKGFLTTFDACSNNRLKETLFKGELRQFVEFPSEQIRRKSSL